MKVILQKPVEALGQPGDVAEVADGYARNYLIPKGLAIAASKGALRQAEQLRRAHEARLAQRRAEVEAMASKLTAAGPLRIAARAGEEGRLFGSVTSTEVAAAVAAAAGVDVDRRDVHLPEPIRSLGTHEVRVRLFPGVEPVLTVEVVAQEA